MSNRWYIVQVLSGYEEKVAQIIKEQADKKSVANYFEHIIVPSEGVVEVRKGKKVNKKSKFFPGYILVKMNMNDASWHLVRNIPKVTGFLGANSKPQPISDAEVEKVLKQIEEGSVSSKAAVTYEVGESVKVIDGPFESFVGVVEGVDLEKSRLKVSVSIFGRSTPIELEFTQVEKV